MTKKFIFAADSHLKKNIWASRPDILYDTFYSFEQLVTYAILHKIPAIVLGGDTLDNTTPSSEVITFLAKEVQRAKLHNIKILGIDGNHDGSKTSNTSWLDICGIERLDLSPAWNFLDSGYNLLGVPYRPIDTLRAAIDSTVETAQVKNNNTNILVMHQLLDITCPLEGMFNLKAEWIPVSVPLVLLGDYHVTTIVAKGKTSFMYPGSGAMMSISESPKKYFYVIDLSNGISYESVQLVTRNFVNLLINSEVELDSEIEKIRDYLTVNNPNPSNSKYHSSITKSLVFVQYLPSIPNIVDKLKTAVGNAATLVLRPIVVKTEENKKVMTEANFGDLLSSFIDPKENKCAFDFASVLGTSRDGVDVVAAVAALYKQFNLGEEQ